MITSAWTKRHKVTIDHTKVTTGDHTDFPVLISGANLLDDCYTVAKSDGSDIRFSSDADGVNELACEIAGWNQGAKTSEVWVKIPTLSSATDVVIYVWYGNAAATLPAANSTYGSQAVWSNGFQAVWHLTDLHDSSPNGYDLTGENSPSATTTNVKIGGGYSFNGSNQSLSIASAPNCKITGAQTWTAWAKFNAIQTGGGQAILGVTNNNSGLQNTDVGGWGSLGIVFGTTNPYCRNANQDTNLNRFAARYDGSNVASIFNKNVASQASTGSKTNDYNNVTIGKTTNNVYYMGGTIDEVRIVSASRSNAWLDTEYDNQNAPLTFSAGADAILYPWPAGVINYQFI